MMAKPMKPLEFQYTMIQFLITACSHRSYELDDKKKKTTQVLVVVLPLWFDLVFEALEDFSI